MRPAQETQRETSWSTQSCRARWGFEDDYDEGLIPTSQGFVSVYAQGDSRSFARSSLRFIFEGVEYSRTWDYRYSRRYLTTLAKRFARDVYKAGHNFV